MFSISPTNNINDFDEEAKLNGKGLLSNFVIPGDFVAPSTFDARSEWPTCATNVPVSDRGACASSWAFATTEAVSYRACARGTHPDILLSAQYPVSCFFSWFFDGCDGKANSYRTYL